MIIYKKIAKQNIIAVKREQEITEREARDEIFCSVYYQDETFRLENEYRKNNDLGPYDDIPEEIVNQISEKVSSEMWDDLEAGNSVDIGDYYLETEEEKISKQLVYFDDLFPPTVEIASQVLRDALLTEEGKKSYIAKVLEPYLNNPDESRSLLEACFGINEELYEEAALLSVTGDYMLRELKNSKGESVKFLMDPEGIRLYMVVPSDDAISDSEDDYDLCLVIEPNMIDEEHLAPRTMIDLSPAILDRILMGIEECGNQWLNCIGYPTWFDFISLKDDEVDEICTGIIDICCGPFRNLLQNLGYSQSEFSRRYHIPLRTVQEWCREDGKGASCRLYQRVMFAQAEGLLPSRPPKKKGNDL